MGNSDFSCDFTRDIPLDFFGKSALPQRIYRCAGLDADARRAGHGYGQRGRNAACLFLRRRGILARRDDNKPLELDHRLDRHAVGTVLRQCRALGGQLCGRRNLGRSFRRARVPAADPRALPLLLDFGRLGLHGARGVHLRQNFP